MHLIPFHHTFADFILENQSDPEQRRFFRGLDRYLTPDECANFNKLFTEVFGVIEKNELIGIGTIKQVVSGVYDIGVLVSREQQNKCKGTWIAKELEKYLFHVKHCRKIMIYVAKDHGLIRVVEEDLGYKFAGCLKEHTFVNGKYEDLLVYEKMR